MVLIGVAGISVGQSTDGAEPQTDDSAAMSTPVVRAPDPIVAIISSVDTKSSRELAQILRGAPETSITSLTTTDAVSLLELMSLARQESDHVRRSIRLSYLVPGLGHYVNGDTRRGLGYLVTETAVEAFAFGMVYLFLPPAIQWRNLNYLQSSFVTIEDRWQNLTPSDLIPSISIAIAGAILSSVVRYYAGEDAARAAVVAIDQGRVNFAPKPIVLIGE